MKRVFLISMVLLPVLAGTLYGPPIVWPSDSAWKPLLQDNGQYFWDSTGDESPAQIDVVGDTTTYPGAYWLYDCCGTSGTTADDQLLFRILVDEQPATAANYVWSIIIDTNQDGLVEWGLQIDGKNNNVVELVPAVTGGLTIGEVQFSTTPSWSGAIADYSRFVAAPSNINGSPDGFVDFGIPWSTFASITGVNTGTSLAYAAVTSATDQLISRDVPMGLDGNAPVSSVLSSNRPVVPEPTTLVLFAAVFGGSLLRRKRQPREL